MTTTTKKAPAKKKAAVKEVNTGEIPGGRVMTEFEVTDVDLSNLRWHALVKLAHMAGAIRDSTLAERPARIASLRCALDRIEEFDAEIDRRKQAT